MKFSLKYPKELIDKPILSDTILETKTKVNIIKAMVDGRIGEYIVIIEKGKEKKFIESLKKKGLIVEEIKEKMNVNTEKCIDCGACVSICPVSALSMENFELKLDENKCVLCRNCIKTCPFNALSIK